MNDYLPLLLIPLCALCDRIRGGLIPDEWFPAADICAELVYGAALACALGLPLVFWFPVAVLWTAGGRPGWGYPMGQALLGKVQHAYAHPNAKPERWQFGPLKSKPWPSLIVRGLMWGAPSLVLAYWQPVVVALPIGMAIAMPAAAFFDRVTGLRYKAGEWIRGGLMATFCLSVPA